MRPFKVLLQIFKLYVMSCHVAVDQLMNVELIKNMTEKFAVKGPKNSAINCATKVPAKHWEEFPNPRKCHIHQQLQQQLRGRPTT